MIRPIPALVGWLLIGATRCLLADQVVMHSGNTYHGTVLSVSSNTVVFQSGVLGRVTLPRSGVSSISLGAVPATNSLRVAVRTNLPPHPAAATPVNVIVDQPAALLDLGRQTNLISQVQAEYLGAAGPAANARYNQMMGDLMSGKMSLGDLRGQARAAADQLRAFKQELGDEAGGAELDAYLAILDNFLMETTSTTGAAVTNPPQPAVAPPRK